MSFKRLKKHTKQKPNSPDLPDINMALGEVKLSSAFFVPQLSPDTVFAICACLIAHRTAGEFGPIPAQLEMFLQAASLFFSRNGMPSAAAWVSASLTIPRNVSTFGDVRDIYTV